MESWKKSLEQNLRETSKRLESEIASRAELENILNTLKTELEEEIKAREEMNRLKKEYKKKAKVLQSRLADLESLKQKVEQEEATRKEWTVQLEIEQQKLSDRVHKNPAVVNENSVKLEEELSELKRTLEEEARERSRLETSKKVLEDEAQQLRFLLQKVEISKNQIEAQIGPKVASETERMGEIVLQLRCEISELKSELEQERKRNKTLENKVGRSPEVPKLKEEKITPTPTEELPEITNPVIKITKDSLPGFDLSKLSFKDRLKFWKEFEEKEFINISFASWTTNE